MTDTDPGGFPNSLKNIKDYLGTKEKPVEGTEFTEFWKALLPSEQEELRTMKLK